jgi:hypothetical protein
MAFKVFGIIITFPLLTQVFAALLSYTIAQLAIIISTSIKFEDYDSI